MNVLLQECTGTRMLPNCTATFFDYKTVQGHTRTLPNFTAAFFISKFEGFCTFFTTRPYGGTLSDCTAGGTASNFGASALFLTTRLHGGNHPNDGSFFPSRKPNLFDNIIHLLHSGIHCNLDHSRSILHNHVTAFDHLWGYTRLYGCTIPNNTAASSNLGASAHFLDYQTARVLPPRCWLLFPRQKSIIFNIIIIIHLLHSCIHCNSGHSCSILHKSRDCFRPVFFRSHYGRGVDSASNRNEYQEHFLG